MASNLVPLAKPMLRWQEKQGPYYDNLPNRLGLPYVRNFLNMSRISVLKFVSSNNF